MLKNTLYVICMFPYVHSSHISNFQLLYLWCKSDSGILYRLLLESHARDIEQGNVTNNTQYPLSNQVFSILLTWLKTQPK